jgi:hypothetical protein
MESNDAEDSITTARFGPGPGCFFSSVVTIVSAHREEREFSCHNAAFHSILTRYAKKWIA